MTAIRIVPLDGPAEPILSPDTVWNEITGDWALEGAARGENRYGLRAQQQLATAIVLALMTDARAEPDELPDGSDNRGWPGDTFDLREDLGERPIGSKLWLLRRSTATAATAAKAEIHAREALQPLIDQRAVAAFDVTAAADPARNRIDLAVTARDRAGAVTYDGRFAVLWEQVRGVERPLDL